MREVIFGDRLHQARTIRQRKLNDLADLLGCSASSLSKWEHARSVDLSERQLAVLSETLRFNPHFFSTRPAAPLTDNDLLFKAPKAMRKRETAWLREFVRLVSELLDWLDERRHLPPVKIGLVSREHADVRSAAEELRTALGLRSGEPVDYLTHAAERAGVVVAVRRRKLSEGEPWTFSGNDTEPDINERHEGCSSWVGEFRERPLILMRGVTGWEKTRWVLAHELGHLALHAGRMPVSDEAEDEASRFASELLAPIREISKELPRVVTLAALLNLKFKWGISLAALIRHLHSNGVITDQRKKTLYDQLYTRRNPETGRTYGATEPGWDSSPPERPQLISAWLKHITGSLNPESLALSISVFPADLLGSILTEQRSSVTPIRESVNRASDVRGGVVHLSDHIGDRGQETPKLPLSGTLVPSTARSTARSTVLVLTAVRRTTSQ